MNTTIMPEAVVGLPDRPWVLAGPGVPCLIEWNGRRLLPVFRTAAACRAFMAGLGPGVPDGYYPQLPDAAGLVRLLSGAVREGAAGYVLMDPDRWYVIGFTGAAAAPALAGTPA